MTGGFGGFVATQVDGGYLDHQRRAHGLLDRGQPQRVEGDRERAPLEPFDVAGGFPRRLVTARTARRVGLLLGSGVSAENAHPHHPGARRTSMRSRRDLRAKALRYPPRTAFLAAACLAAASCGEAAEEAAAGAAPATVLWTIGVPDGGNAELALAPDRYRDFSEDAVFAAGLSDPRRDWPYVHPGPADDWAGGREHTFVVLFGLKAAPVPGDCRLRVDLVDTHSRAPPALRVAVNGKAFEVALPAGAGDASVFGDPRKGKPHSFEVAFPPDLLKA
ncbi:MAG: hypothetical protein HY721_17850, partial [Planctomycetes bacterium]|nr:hypothetical protein [Planctomycetota bacterium]